MPHEVLPSPPGDGRQRRPRFRRVSPEERPPLKLKDRDREVLKIIYDYRFLTAAMLQNLMPPAELTERQQKALDRLIAARRARLPGVEIEPRTPGTKREVQRRLQALYHHGFVQRLKLSDGDPIVYALGNRGADELTLHYGVDRQQIDWTTKNREAGERYMAHGLMVSRFRHALTLALHDHNNLTLGFWQPNGAFKTAVTYDETRTTQGGEKRTEKVSGTVQPDGFFTLTDGHNASYFFLEADRSTMSNVRYLAKLKAYYHFWYSQVRTGKYLSGMKGFRVLTITRSEARAEHLRKIASDVNDEGRALNLFWFACERRYCGAPGELLADIWRTPQDDTRWRSIIAS